MLYKDATLYINQGLIIFSGYEIVFLGNIINVVYIETQGGWSFEAISPLYSLLLTKGNAVYSNSSLTATIQDIWDTYSVLLPFYSKYLWDTPDTDAREVDGTNYILWGLLRLLGLTEDTGVPNTGVFPVMDKFGYIRAYAVNLGSNRGTTTIVSDDTSPGTMTHYLTYSSIYELQSHTFSTIKVVGGPDSSNEGENLTAEETGADSWVETIGERTYVYYVPMLLSQTEVDRAALTLMTGIQKFSNLFA